MLNLSNVKNQFSIFPAKFKYCRLKLRIVGNFLHIILYSCRFKMLNSDILIVVTKNWLQLWKALDSPRLALGKPLHPPAPGHHH